MLLTRFLHEYAALRQSRCIYLVGRWITGTKVVVVWVHRCTLGSLYATRVFRKLFFVLMYLYVYTRTHHPRIHACFPSLPELQPLVSLYHSVFWIRILIQSSNSSNIYTLSCCFRLFSHARDPLAGFMSLWVRMSVYLYVYPNVVWTVLWLRTREKFSPLSFSRARASAFSSFRSLSLSRTLSL